MKMDNLEALFAFPEPFVVEKSCVDPAYVERACHSSSHNHIEKWQSILRQIWKEPL
jgi:hypothetical protein